MWFHQSGFDTGEQRTAISRSDGCEHAPRKMIVSDLTAYEHVSVPRCRGKSRCEMPSVHRSGTRQQMPQYGPGAGNSSLVRHPLLTRRRCVFVQLHHALDVCNEMNRYITYYTQEAYQ